MADSQQAMSQASQQEILDLQDELGFQLVLLKSIDDTVHDHENATQQVKQEIAQLEKRLKVLKRGTRTTASSPSHTSSFRYSQASQASPSKKTPSKKQSDLAKAGGEAESMNGYTNREPWPAQAPVDSTASTPNSHSADSFPELNTPSQMSLPSRKRTHSSHLDGGLAPYSYGDNKSRRTSPSPYTASPATPSGASSGYGDPMIGDGFFDLTMDEEFAALDDFFELQKAAESRLQLERADAEFARSLQDDGFAVVDQGSISGPSAFDRLSGVRPQASSSSLPNPPSSSARAAFDQMSAARQESNSAAIKSRNRENAHLASSRKLPPGWNNGSSQPSQYRPVKSEVPSMASGVKMENRNNPFQPRGSGSTSSFIPASKVKSEQGYSMPGSYRDDSSTASDSDIEVIPASAFRANGRNPTTSASGLSQHSGYSPESQAAGNAALRRFGQAASNDALQRAMYGYQQLPSWMSGQAGPAQPFGSTIQQTPSMSMGMGMSRSAQGQYVYPSAYNGYPGMGMPKQEGGLGYHVSSDGTILLDPMDSLATGQPSYDADFSGFNFNEQMAEQYDYIVNDPRKTNAEIKSLLENIRPDLDLLAENREGTPEGLKYPLYEHQKLALTWLKSMEQGTNKGGILADDMGLGKTISALALILSHPSNDRTCKTTLIVGPVALVRQWEREIRHKINASHSLSSYLVHGQQKKLSWDDLQNYDVVLTTYGTLAAEAKRMEKYIDKEKKAGRMDIDQIPMKKLFPLLGPKSVFYRVFLDEAQCIKNKLTQSARAACTVKSIYRFCLTGTPMMNNVGELYSLIHFLRIRPYNEYARFQTEFGMLTKGASGKRDTDNAMKKLQTVLKAILLRRTKQSEIDGKPIITLPPKTTEIQHVVFNDDELEFYKALESKTQIQFNKYLRQGTVGKNYSNILVLLLRLRQACCHPHLIMDFEAAPPVSADDALMGDVMKELAESLQPDVVKRLLEAEGFECPICYDGVPNPSITIPCGHTTCAECLTSVSEKAAQDNIVNGNEGGAQAKCPSCRGQLDSKKVIDFKSFNKVHNPQTVADDETASEASDSSSDETDSETEEESDVDADSDGDLRGFVVPDDIEETENEAEGADEDDNEGYDEAEVDLRPKKASKDGKKSGKCHKKDKKGKGKAKEKKPHLSLAMLKKEASKSVAARRRYMKYLRKHWEPSAKVTKCVELLEQFQEEGEKTIIFSQFVSLLDLLQVPIDQKGWNMERYDGSMSADARHSAIMRFTDKPNCKIMLISLKAGNAGLNLVAASRVIILDPFWNPYIEMQAVDRAYRIGQQKAVHVHRILIESTVEDRIIELQEQKRKLVDSALDEGASKSLGRLDDRQLAFLFGVQR